MLFQLSATVRHSSPVPTPSGWVEKWVAARANDAQNRAAHRQVGEGKHKEGEGLLSGRQRAVPAGDSIRRLVVGLPVQARRQGARYGARRLPRRIALRRPPEGQGRPRAPCCRQRSYQRKKRRSAEKKAGGDPLGDLSRGRRATYR